MINQNERLEINSDGEHWVATLIDSLWNEYRVRNYMSPPESGFRVQEISAIPKSEWKERLNIDRVSDYSHGLEFFDIDLSVHPGFFDKHDDFSLLLSGGEDLGDFLRDREDNGHVRFQLVMKQMSMEMGNHMRESEGYERLNEFGMKTPLCIYPNILTEQPVTLDSKLAEPFVVTILEEGLDALDGQSEQALFGHNPGGIPIIAKVFNALATMHINQFTHGDALLKNFGVKDDELYVLDPEFSIDFKRLPADKNALTKAEEFIYLSAIEVDPKDFGTRIHLMGAIDYDLRSLAKSIDEAHDLNEESRFILQEAVESYIEKIKESYPDFEEDFIENIRGHFQLHD